MKFPAGMRQEPPSFIGTCLPVCLAACLAALAPASLAQQRSGGETAEGPVLAPVEPPLVTGPAAEDSADGTASDAASDTERPADAGTAAAAEADQDPEPQRARQFVSRLEAQLVFSDLVAERRYAEAAEVGAQLLSLTEAEFGATSEEYVAVLTLLGEMQRRLDEHEGAEETFLRAIDIARGTAGIFSEPVIAPMVGLGSTYHDDGQYVNAAAVFNEARSVSRRVFGLLNEDQILIMDRLTETFYAMERFEDADAIQRDALQIAERNHEPGSPELLEAIYKYAGWLRRNGQYHVERQLYARAMDMVRERFGDGSHHLVEPLRETANSFRLQRLPEGQGLGALRRALGILESAPDEHPLALAETLRDMGDWQVAFSKVGADGSEYRRAWRVLDRVEDGEALQRRWFSGPEYVLQDPISQRGLSDDPDAVEGRVLVSFDIDEYGRSENVRVVEAVPPGLKEDAVVRSMGRSRFRPHMQDGELVRGEGLALQFTYRYMPDE